ncbi:hypothetical protein GGR56DRAFT_658081 [Xylariaceae sp. FL0804]|nr:hypothetical protein GGR56DRAFT_658081 [Xylariaceae sp. FL0804]
MRCARYPSFEEIRTRTLLLYWNTAAARTAAGSQRALFKGHKANLVKLVNPQHLNKRQFMFKGCVSDDMRSGLGALRGALDPLHSLAFVHNDVNPYEWHDG